MWGTDGARPMGQDLSVESAIVEREYFQTLDSSVPRFNVWLLSHSLLIAWFTIYCSVCVGGTTFSSLLSQMGQGINAAKDQGAGRGGRGEYL